MIRVLFSLVLLVAMTACAERPTPPLDRQEPWAQEPRAQEPWAHVVHVISNGWHTGIAVRQDALLALGLPPEARDFSGATYLEFGWGDRRFYPSNEATVGMALQAALIPTAAITHVVGLRSVQDYADETTEIVSVRLSDDGFRRMVAAISETIERPTGDRALPASGGLYPTSVFYNASGAFHLFNNCNTWVARMLREGGVEIASWGVFTEDTLMRRLREVATPAAR